MNYNYRVANISDLDKIMRIYAEAQAFMEANGNPQWPKGFPDKTDILGGILGGILYCVEDENGIVAVFSAMNYDGDYEEIEGEWLTGGNYLALHRLAVDQNKRGRGIAKYIVSYAGPDIAKRRGRASIRMDTHAKNAPMRGLLASQGFTECGTIRLVRDLTQRIAFEKILKET